jgi:hypothetical protein
VFQGVIEIPDLEDSFQKAGRFLRWQHRELTGRGHLHALIAGFPRHALITTTYLSFMRLWVGQGGG